MNLTDKLLIALAAGQALTVYLALGGRLSRYFRREVEDIARKVQTVEREVLANGGSSMVDKVGRTEQKVDRTSERLTRIEGQLRIIAREIQQIKDNQ